MNISWGDEIPIFLEKQEMFQTTNQVSYHQSIPLMIIHHH